MTVSRCSSLLIKIDQGMDRSMLFTWINNLVDCALKLGLRVHDAYCRYAGKEVQTPQKDYWNYLRQKDVTICMVGLVPALGSIGIRVLQSREKAQVQALYEEFDKMLLHGCPASIEDRLERISPEELAMLWKHPDFALRMLRKDTNNLHYV